MITYPVMSGSGDGVDDPPAPVVLIVEDNPVIQSVARELLLDLGCAPDLADDGLDAVALATIRRYDLIFMDVHMPGLDGPAAAREICARWGDERPWIVAMTANVMPHERRDCLDAGMDEFLLKPLTAAKFTAVLTRLGRRPPAAAAEPAEPAASPDAELVAVRALLVRLAGGVPGGFLAARQTLVDALAGSFAGLEQALVAGDRKAASRCAHSLAGAALTAGLARVGQLASATERACAESRPPAEAAAAFAALAPLCADTLAAVRILPP